MGIVVLRSTTPCVAVSSRRSSNLLTVISMVVAAIAGATSTGILGLPTLLLFSSYIKCKSKKTSSNRRDLGEVENWSRYLCFSCFRIHSSCEQSLTASTETIATLEPFPSPCPISHSFHKHSTIRTPEEWSEKWKTWQTLPFTRLTARSAYSAICLNPCRSCEPLQSYLLNARLSCGACHQTDVQFPAVKLP